MEILQKNAVCSHETTRCARLAAFGRRRFFFADRVGMTDTPRSESSGGKLAFNMNFKMQLAPSRTLYPLGQARTPAGSKDKHSDLN